LLLGPIAVGADYRSSGVGGLLMRASLARAATAGHQLVVLVGDEPYYGRFGFRPAATWGISMLKESPARVLALPIGLAAPEASATVPSGLVQRWKPVRRSAAAVLAA
jgi:predicted N-acetyltransferase YhbS